MRAARALLAALAIACADPPPAPLPPPVQPRALVRQRVKHGAVEGLILRPHGVEIDGTGLLVQVPTLGPPPDAALDAALGAHAMLLAVPPSVDAAAAEAYLAGVPGIRATARACLPAPCAP